MAQTQLTAEQLNTILKRHEDLKNIKVPWLPLYQSLAMYIFLRKQYFTIEYLKTPFMLNFVFDSTAIHAAHMLAATLLGQIMPNTQEYFELVPDADDEDDVDDETYKMFDRFNCTLPAMMAKPESRLYPSREEQLLDLGVFGIGSICVDEDVNDRNTPLRYYSADAKVMCVDENQYSNIDTIYMEKRENVIKVVDRYGYDNCSKNVRELYDKRNFDYEVKILHIIEPRHERDPMKLGNMDMPWRSLHIEMDSRNVLRESGFRELPIIVARFWKNVNEVQGRSPAMDALPDIRALNKLVEMFEKAGEMSLDPPRVLSAEDVLGAGKYAWGPGVQIVRHFSGRMGTDKIPPVELLPITADLATSNNRILDLRENVKEYFMINYFTDLNNTSRQTLGEANIRDEKGMFITGSVLNRILSESDVPLIDRSFNVLLRNGHLGVIPNSVQDIRARMRGEQPKYLTPWFIKQRLMGKKGYRLNFICPAARLMKLEQAKGVGTLITSVQNLSTWRPDAANAINTQRTVRIIQETSGAPRDVLNTPQEIKQIQDIQNKQAAQRQQEQSALTQAHTAKLAGQGAKEFADAHTTVTNPQQAA
jgi:hypothetical protein